MNLIMNEILIIARNILNVKDINEYIEQLIHLVRNKERKEVLEKWIKGNLKNYLKNDYPNTSPITHYDDNAPTWLKKALDTKQEVVHIYIEPTFKQKINHVLDYLNSVDGNISRISVPNAIIQSIEWTKRLNKKATLEEDFDGIKIVKQMGDGFNWVLVSSKHALDREGKLMNHCVGSYYNEVKNDKILILSLRDSKNLPHCTVEYDKQSNGIMQIKGKSNGEVKTEYVKYIKQLMEHPPSFMPIDYVSNTELLELGFVVVDHKWYPISEAPPNTVLEGEVYLGNSSIKELPFGLTITGDLSIDNCPKLKELPAYLTVEGNLDLIHSEIELVPESTVVKGDLLINEAIEVSDEVVVRGRIIMRKR